MIIYENIRMPDRALTLTFEIFPYQRQILHRYQFEGRSEHEPILSPPIESAVAGWWIEHNATDRPLKVQVVVFINSEELGYNSLEDNMKGFLTHSKVRDYLPPGTTVEGGDKQ